MLGKANDVRTEFLAAGYIEDLQSDVNGFLNDNPAVDVVSIQYQMLVDPAADNRLYHVAMIIYRI